MIVLTLLAVINFWLLAIVIGVGFAFGRYAYQEFLEFLYQDLTVIDQAVRRFVKKHYKKHYELIRTYRSRMRQDKYNREELPKLREQTQGARGMYGDSTWAIAQRLMHVKHIRTDKGVLTGEEFTRGQN